MVELMVVIGIAAVLAAVAAPALQGTVNNFRQKSALSLLVSDLNQARGEAIKRNSRVLMCVRNAAGTGCDASTNWLSGWVACLDANADGACDAASASSPNPFIVRPALSAVLTATVVDAAASAQGSLRFNPNSTQGAGNSAVTLTLGGTWTGAVSHTVTVAGTGNISSR